MGVDSSPRMALTIAILNQLRECLFSVLCSVFPTPCSLFPDPLFPLL
ncbi:MAG: hypothetical protein F6K26_11865 [Moorea sp. SIO2I5]|nr:hypothetical protein [Moorena sp. SIO2I5]